MLEQVFSIDTGTVLTINTKTKKLYNADGVKELGDIASALTPQKLEFIRAQRLLRRRLRQEAADHSRRHPRHRRARWSTRPPRRSPTRARASPPSRRSSTATPWA